MKIIKTNSLFFESYVYSNGYANSFDFQPDYTSKEFYWRDFIQDYQNNWDWSKMI